ncbi:hypothetical protein BUE93_22075 [Chromobacterium amazonense]|uniref:Type VI secretion protein n=2 Tax=Chromobacterium amazonense TaxID=1382803 RepID=A0A2S9WYG9_9NEIS|nr:hypothetical protein BUE93_22075 [Chromobacterium amazonense]
MDTSTQAQTAQASAAESSVKPRNFNALMGGEGAASPPASDSMTGARADSAGDPATEAPPAGGMGMGGQLVRALATPLDGQVVSTSASAQGGGNSESGGAAGQNAPATPNKAAVDEAQRITLNPDLYIPANTYIPCVLNTKLITTVNGTARCTVAKDVYSANGRTRLIESGTRVDGNYQSGSLRQGDARIFVAWEQLTTPNFKRIYLTRTGASGELGEAGIGGWVDNHFWGRFGGAMMLSMVQDSLAVASKQGISGNDSIDYTANSREAFAEMAKIALQNSINIPPTLYRNQGEVVGIMTGQDIDFSKVYRLQRISRG